MNGWWRDFWVREDRRIFVSVHVAIFLSLVFGTALGVQGQAGGAGAATKSGAVGGVQPQGGLPAEWDAGVKVLAGKIAAEVKPARAISLEVKNISSLGAAEVEAIRAGLEVELRSRGMKVGASETAVTITISENVEGYVWVAEIRNHDTNRIGIVSVAKPGDATSQLRPALTLQRKIVWRQRNQFLDFEAHDSVIAPIGFGHRTIWDSTGIHSYGVGLNREVENEGGRGIPEFHVPRDPRGLLVQPKGENLRAYFGYAACIDSYTILCGENSSEDWPIGYGAEARFVGNRNYFDGISFVREKKWPAFFSVASNRWLMDGPTPWIEAELDGKSRLYDYGPEPRAVFSDWGDDIASIDLPCGIGWQVLVSGTGDWTEPDHLQLYQISDQNFAKPSGEPLSFPGPILALWSSADGKSVRVVSKNLQTGMYEASIVTVSCSE